MNMKINRTYKFRIYPTKEQENKLAQYFGSVRFLYNYFLNERKVQYEETGKSDNYYIQQKKLTSLKKNKEYAWLNNIATISLQFAIRHLETAYTNFFNKRSAFPTFHKKKGRQSFTTAQNIHFVKNRLHIVGFKEGLKCKISKEVYGKLKEASIVKTCSGKYYANIVAEQDIQVIEKDKKQVGIDLGIESLLITSNGEKFNNPKFINKYQEELSKAQRYLSRKIKGSNQFEKQKLKVAKIQEKIANCRNDNLHKISYKLANEYSDIFMEDLNVKGMQKNRYLAKAISDCSWGTLSNMLEYKGKWYGCSIHRISRWYPSSKTCSVCNYTLESLPLNIRNWTCPKCGEKHNRDINAAKNILKEGLRELSAGTVDYTGGETVRIRNRKNSNQDSMKPEAVCFS